MKTIINVRSFSLVGILLPLLSIACWAAVATSAQAQQPSSADLQRVGGSDRDANTNGDLTNINSMFDLLHRVQQGSIRDPYEFNRDQQQTIQSEASTFRQRQMERLNQTGAATSTPPSPAPSAEIR